MSVSAPSGEKRKYLGHDGGPALPRRHQIKVDVAVATSCCQLQLLSCWVTVFGRLQSGRLSSLALRYFLPVYFVILSRQLRVVRVKVL